MIKYISIFLTLFTLISCGSKEILMKTPTGAAEKLENFIAKEKFNSETFYLGLANKKLQPLFTKQINEAAHDFQIISKSKNPTNIKYQEKIGIGLSKFSGFYEDLDTEDRERICSYFEELMDIVELESSDGKLNWFMYGFDPS